MTAISPDASSRSAFAAFLRDRREEILQEWEAEAKQQPPARALSTTGLEDHVPQLLARLADCIDDACGAVDLADLPHAHALRRLDEGYEVEQVVTEYRLLRRAIVRRWRLQGSASALDEIALLDDLLDEAMVGSVRRFVATRNRTLHALERVASAALASHDVEGFLAALLGVLQSSTPVVDSAAIYLLEGEHLVVRAAVGAAHAGALGKSVALGRCIAGRVAEARRAWSSDAPAYDARVESDTIDPAAVAGLHGEPLVSGDEIVGVVVVGSSTSAVFSEDDLLLVRATAGRATSLLMLARSFERERAAKADAERNLALLDAFLASSPIGVAFLDEDLRYVRVNATLAALNGASVADHVGRTPREVLGDRAEVVEPVLRRILATGEPARDVELDAPRMEPPHDVGTFLVSFFPVPERGGRRGVGGLVVDVTAQKRAEREKEEARALLDTLIRTAPIGLAFWDRGLRFVHANDALAEMNGASVEAHLGRRVQDVLPGVLGQALAARLEQILATGEPVTDVEVVGETEAQPGVVRCWLASYYPVRGPDGAVLGIGGVVQEITRRKRQEAQLAEEAAVRERFVGILGHDLRNPLHAITMSAEQIARTSAPGASEAKLAARVLATAGRMQRMIDDVVDFAATRVGGGLPLQLAVADLASIVQRGVDELRAAHPDARIELEAPTWCPARVDADRLAQVVSNLVGNALKHGARGRPVTVRVERDPGGTSVSVHNEGAPIPPDVLPRVFEAFERGATGAGVGLGLFIVDQIVRAHGGTVDVESTAERGTTFRVRLPQDGAPAPTTRSGAP